jgi:hypothetical protein
MATLCKWFQIHILADLLPGVNCPIPRSLPPDTCPLFPLFLPIQVILYIQTKLACSNLLLLGHTPLLMSAEHHHTLILLPPNKEAISSAVSTKPAAVLIAATGDHHGYLFESSFTVVSSSCSSSSSMDLFLDASLFSILPTSPPPPSSIALSIQLKGAQTV